MYHRCYLLKWCFSLILYWLSVSTCLMILSRDLWIVYSRYYTQKKKKGQVNHKDKDFIPGLNFLFFCLIGLFVIGNKFETKERKFKPAG